MMRTLGFHGMIETISFVADCAEGAEDDLSSTALDEPVFGRLRSCGRRGQ